MNYGYQYNPAAAAAAFYPAAAQAVMQPQQAAPARFVAPANVQATQFNPNFNKYPQNPINPAAGSYSAVGNPGGPGFNSPPKQNVQTTYKPSYTNFVPAGANKPPPNNPNPQPPPPQQSHYSGNKGPQNYNQSNNNTHNEKFEKAVINAAISVAQQREGGGGGFGRGGGGGGRGGYGGGPGGSGGYNRPPRQWAKKPSGGDNQMHYCEVCKISCGGEQTFKTHIEGKQHKKKEAQMKAGGSLVMSSLKPGMTAFHCELCDITCTSQDAFNSHTAGAKHQKVAKLHEKLGKPVPQLSSAKEAQVKIVAASGVNIQQTQAAGTGGTAGSGPAGSLGFKAGPGGSSSTVAVPITSALAMSTNDGDDQVANEIIGAEYVEVIEMGDGKVVQYNCKLCECKFNDANAKDLHLKGRRHRLSYKKKVNPSLVVENPAHRAKQRRQEQDRLNRMRAGSAATLGGLSQSDSVWAMKEEMKKMEDELYARFGGGGASSNKKAESFDDRHVLAKHQTIYPDEATLEVVQDIVVKTEKALKIVSDKIYEEDKAKAQEESLTAPAEKQEPGLEGDASPEKQSQPEEQKQQTVKTESDVAINDDDEAAKYRELKGVMRIGTLAKGLMLKGDTRVSLAVLCQHWPTTIVLSRMFKFLPSVLKEISESEEDPFDISLRLNDGVIVIQSKHPPVITLTVYLTSPVCRTENETPTEGGIAAPVPESEEKPKPAANSQEALEEKSKIPKDVCLAVLAELRHQKWFEARASGLASCVIIVRVIYDLINRVSSWNPLPRWAAELLVEKALSCSAQSFMSPGDALRRVIETIASGVLLPEGCGLLDPCERDRMDAAGALTHQQREDITASAQHALRLITFKSIHKVLGIQPLPSVDRKRPAAMMTPGTANPPAGPLTGAKVTKL